MYQVFKQCVGVLALLLACTGGTHAASAIAGYDGYVAHYSWVDHDNSLAGAKHTAMDSCKKMAQDNGVSPTKCSVWASQAHPGYWSVFNRPDGGIAWAYSERSQQDATNKAYEACAKGSGCDETAARVWHDDGSPASPYVVSCVNGECTRRYKSGEVLHFRACLNTNFVAFDNLDGSCTGFDLMGHYYGQVDVSGNLQ